MSNRVIETCNCFKSIYTLDKGLSYHGTLCARCVTTDKEGCPGFTLKTMVQEKERKRSIAMDVDFTYGQNYIRSQIKRRLLKNNHLTRCVCDKAMNDLCFSNIYYLFNESDFKADFLDLFYSDNGRYKIGFKKVANGNCYHFYYAETDKYKLLKMME